LNRLNVVRHYGYVVSISILSTKKYNILSLATSKNTRISLKFDAGMADRTSSHAKINLVTIP
jgi:hypothetical protein